MTTEQTPDARALRQPHVCTPKHVHLFDNFLRPLLHNPRKLFAPYVQPGMTVLDVGCGKGFASLGLARLVGEHGLVVSADLQPEMLQMLEERAARAGLSDRIRLHQCEADRVGIHDELDFALAFWMVHELPDAGALLREVFALLKPCSQLFIAEPMVHISRRDFDRMAERALQVGFTVANRPRVALSRAVVLAK